MAGDYDTRLVLQGQSGTQDEYGRPSVSWETIWSGWCRRRDLGSTEYWQAAAENQQESSKLFCRPCPALLDAKRRGSLRAVVAGRPMRVLSISQAAGRDSEIVVRVTDRGAS